MNRLFTINHINCQPDKKFGCKYVDVKTTGAFHPPLLTLLNFFIFFLFSQERYICFLSYSLCNFEGSAQSETLNKIVGNSITSPKLFLKRFGNLITPPKLFPKCFGYLITTPKQFPKYFGYLITPPKLFPKCFGSLHL